LALSFGERIIYSIIAFGVYTYKAVLPVNQVAIYAFTESGSLEYYLQLIFAVSIIGLFTYLIIRFWRTYHLLVFGILFFCINIFLTLHIVAVNSSLIYERFTYVSYIGLFLIAAHYLLKRKTYFSIILISAFGVLTHARSKVWKDSGTFWTDVIQKNPKSHEALNNRGQYYFDKGDMQKAIADCSQSMIIQPGQPYSYNNRSVTYFHLKEYDKSLADNLQAIAIDSFYFDAVNNRGIIYYGMARYDSAEYWYHKALQLSPHNAGVYKYLAATYLQRGHELYKAGNADGALNYYLRAAEIQPDNAEAYYNIGGIYLTRQDVARAKEYWRKTLEVNPQHQLAREWLQKIGG
jgi:tetratricopeptide (TPR) repeat protein